MSQEKYIIYLLIHIEERSNKDERRLYIYINLVLESMNIGFYFNIYIFKQRYKRTFSILESSYFKGENTQINIYILVYNIVFQHFISTKGGYVKKEQIHILINGDR